MLPIAILGCAILIPINVSQGGIEKKSQSGAIKDIGNPSEFMKLAMTNVDDPNVLWVHFFLTLLFVLYTCWILNWHYHNFVIIRQHYMKKGNCSL